LLGFTNAAKGVDTFTMQLKMVQQQLLQLHKSKLDIAQRQAQKTQLDYQK
jgi:hypothetical protein